MRTIIIDDEAHNRQTLRSYLDRYCPEVEVVAEANGVASGLKMIQEHAPDLLFLDIEMPFGNGFDLIEQLPRDFKAAIIFVTAYEQYALRALNLSAAHYLLKPVDIDELIAAVEKVKNRQGQAQQQRLTQSLLDHLATPKDVVPSRITLPTLQGFEIVTPSEITHCESEDNFTRFHLTNGKQLLICRTLKFYTDLLKAAGFCRIHRSTLVNLTYVRRYQRGKGGSITLENGKELLVSASRKQELLDRLGS